MSTMTITVTEDGTEYELTADKSLINGLSDAERLAARLRALGDIGILQAGGSWGAVAFNVGGTHRHRVTEAIRDEGFVIRDIAACRDDHEYNHYIYALPEGNDVL